MRTVMKCILIPAIILAGLAFTGSSSDYLSGSELFQPIDPHQTAEWYEATGTSPSDYDGDGGIEEDVSKSMAGDSIFFIDPRYGMTPGITPVTTTETTFANISGNWTIVISGGINGTIELVLFQVNGIVFGYGTMNVDGTALEVTACGALTDSALYLDIVTLGDVNLGEVNLYGLNLTIGDNTVGGSYVAYGPTGKLGFGAAAGTRPI